MLAPPSRACAGLRRRDHYGPAAHSNCDPMVKSTSRRTGPKKRPARPAPARKASRRKARAGQAPRQKPSRKASGKAKWVYASATARPKAAPTCATSSAARAPASPRWPISACRCRPASPSRPRSARTTTPTTRRYPEGPSRAGRRRARRGRPHHRQGTSATATNPLLVSVRSGARASMPGMMDTVLNLGLNDETVEALAKQIRRPALRLRFLPPLHHDVFRRGARHRASPLRGNPRRPQGHATATRSTPISPPTTGSSWSRATRSGSRRSTASRSRRTRTSSCGARSARCSAPG